MKLRSLLLTALFLGSTLAQAAAEPKVLLVAAAPVQAGKLAKLQPLAKQAGLDVDYQMLGKGQSVSAEQLSQYQALIVDAPYGAAQGTAQMQLAPLLPGVKQPWLWLKKMGGHSAQGFSQDEIKRLDLYYSNGGASNYQGFFCQLAGSLKQQPVHCPEPIVHPESGIYHPKAVGEYFPSLEAYLAWRKTPIKPGQPVVGVLVHRSYIDAGMTSFIDDTIDRLEQRGAVVIPLFTSAMGTGEIAKLLSSEGKLRAQVLINMQIMLNAEGRRQEFAQLGIPVLQTMPYRAGDQAAWQADNQGLDPQDIPFYLAQPEYAGLIDPIFAAATRQQDGDILSIDRQLQTVVDKALRMARLQSLPVAQVKTGILFYNYPPGEKNLGASFMNVPQSLEQLLKEYAARGYQVKTQTEQQLIDELSSLLAPFYRDDQLQTLLTKDRAGRLSLADYQKWFATLPEASREAINARWGAPEQAGLFLKSQQQFVIPRLQLGNQVIVPQPPRGEREGDKEKALYHDTKVPPSHSYLATYLWLREQAKIDALVHFGTHGSAEWQPGKERGVDVLEAPFLVLGDLPVIYPYIVDNIGEALQTKRRGRAVTISHNTPSFGPAGLHDQYTELHDLLHRWLAMTEGEVRGATAQQIVKLAGELKMDKDLALDLEQAQANFTQLVDTLHLHLHELALAQQPLGLAHFGLAAEDDLRLFTVQQMLGMPLLEAVMPEDPQELLAVDYQQLKTTELWQLLDKHVRQNQPWQGEAKLGALLKQGRDYWEKLANQGELDGYFNALRGGFTPTSYGGDPIKNPDSLPTGRNLYGFDPSRIPTKEAWEAGKVAAERLLEQHKAAKGAYPKKLAFTLWSVETMRHYGMLEAQIFALLGYEPVWDAGGRVTGLRALSREELKRPRIDTVISATGLYRDQFPQVMSWLAQAADQASRLDESDNAVALNSRQIEQQLKNAGLSAEDAALAARTRIFSSESGAYSTGLEDATLASDSFGEGADGKADRAAGEEKLANLYLEKMQFAYGPDSSKWGQKSPQNIYAAQLKGVEGAVLSRSSNLYGMLTTDDPFQYLGGMGLAVRQLTGQSPELYISNLRDAKNPKSETAAGFLARDLRTRYLHPGWIKQVQKEGYSGALEVLGSANNLWGWQVTAPETVRDDQWAEYKAVYVDDKYNLKINEWFEKNHPQAQAQLIERMLEAARKEYWQADAKDLQQLAQRYQELAERYDVQTDNQKFKDYLQSAAAGFGLAAGQAPEAQSAPASEAPAAASEQVQGQKLEKQAEPQPAPATPFDPSSLVGLALIVLALLAGVLRQSRRTYSPAV